MPVPVEACIEHKRHATAPKVDNVSFLAVPFLGRLSYLHMDVVPAVL